MFKVILFVHIASAIGLFVSLGVLFAAMFGLRKATTTGHAEVVMAATSKVKLVSIVSTVLVLLSGLYMMGSVASHHKDIGWIIVALIGFIAMGVLGSVIGDRETKALQRELVSSKGTLPEVLRRKAKDPRALSPLIYDAWLAIGILALMIFQPSAALAVVVLAVSLIIGFLISLSLNAQSHTAVR